MYGVLRKGGIFNLCIVFRFLKGNVYHNWKCKRYPLKFCIHSVKEILIYLSETYRKSVLASGANL